MSLLVHPLLALVTGLGATVTPSTPAPDQPVIVRFTAPRAIGDGSHWYQVAVSAPSRSSRCEFYEEALATVAAKGAPVSVVLRAVDKGRWCRGRYSGTITLQARVRCDDRIDDGICTTERTLGNLSFTAG